MPRPHGIRRIAPSVALFACAAVVGAGGWALAAPKRSTSIKACANRHTGALRLATHCRHKTERSVVWSKVGPRGLQGPKGATGSAGAPGAPGTPGAPGIAGPGATLQRWQVAPSGDESAPFQTVGKVGEWTMFARCITNTDGDTEVDLNQAGPSAILDSTHSEWQNSSATDSITKVVASRVPESPLSSPAPFDLDIATGVARSGSSWDGTYSFDDGQVIHAQITTTASQTSTPFCSFAAVTFPVTPTS